MKNDTSSQYNPEKVGQSEGSHFPILKRQRNLIPSKTPAAWLVPTPVIPALRDLKFKVMFRFSGSLRTKTNKNKQKKKQKARTVKKEESLNLRPAWSTYQVPGWPNQKIEIKMSQAVGAHAF